MHVVATRSSAIHSLPEWGPPLACPPPYPIPSDESSVFIAAISNTNFSYSNTPQPSQCPPPLPVTAILGMSPYLMASICPPNESSILGGGDSDLLWDSTDSVSTNVPFVFPHLPWLCSIDSLAPWHLAWVHTIALFDHGSPTVLINTLLIAKLHLKQKCLPNPFPVSTAFFESTLNIPCPSDQICLTEWVKLKLYNWNNLYATHTVWALITPSLCHPIILGLPFMHHNDITINVQHGSAIDNNHSFNLLNPTSRPVPIPKCTLKDSIAINIENHKHFMHELQTTCACIRPLVEARCEKLSKPNFITAICEHIEQLLGQEILTKLNDDVKDTYVNIFWPIPHVDEMPDNVHCKIMLKDSLCIITTQTYSCSQKYKEAWSILIQQHLDTGCIQPSSSTHASPAFLIPKVKKTVLPHWVNDYWQLNSNTVMDSYPLPHVDDILSDAGCRKIWSKIDMTDSFFHTKMDPESIHLTAVTMPLSLYEWTVMPQGL